MEPRSGQRQTIDPKQSTSKRETTAGDTSMKNGLTLETLEMAHIAPTRHAISLAAGLTFTMSPLAAPA